ncbi:MAG: transcriptional coactivator p15/PC4 family protein [Syntrophorhabdaceae bacterium]|nr:transcriptional coactivator p15/PC4 family protein [Syntrophorhabdaceae bacterium]
MKVIGRIDRNKREIIQISLAEYKGKPLVDVRICWEHGNQYLFSKRGVTIKPENLEAVISLLEKARDELVAK